ncbi:MAG: LpxL/LpxP family acyltransferase [Promethearchaeota archaeon]
MSKQKKEIKMKNRDKKTRAEQLSGLFKINEFIHHYQIFRPFQLFPKRVMNIIASKLADKFMKSSKLKARLMEGLDLLYGDHISKEKKEELYLNNVRFMAMLYLESIFFAPNLNFKTYSQYISLEGKKYLDKALEKGNGAIVTSTHIGMFTYFMGAFGYHKNKYPLMTVVSARNFQMYSNIVNRPELRHFKLLKSRKWSVIKKSLVSHLKKNGIVAIYYDYSKRGNLRVPFWDGKYPYLITTPQSVIRLHTLTNAPIIPAILLPKSLINKAHVKFLDPAPLKEASKRISDHSGKEYHGELSTILNKMYGPYFRTYIEFWEEFRKFGHRIMDVFVLEHQLKMNEVIIAVKEKIHEIIDNSYERNRDDEQILKETDEILIQVEENLLHSDNVINQGSQKDQKLELTLSYYSGVGKIYRLLKMTKSILIKNKESKAAQILEDFTLS